MYVERPLVREPYPAGLLRHSRELLAGIVESVGADPRARLAAALVLERFPQHAEQIGQAARRLDADPIDLTLANISYDLSMALFGCSTMALATPDGPVLARNMDWMLPERIARASCVTELPDGRSAGFLGAVGVVSGQSRHGFAVILNAVATGAANPLGYPVLLFLRHLLDVARSFDEAVRLAETTPLASPALLTLIGTANRQRVCVERAPTAARLRWAEGDRPLLVTNHYRQLAEAHWCPRYECLEARSPRLPSCAADDLLGLLTHADVRQSITAQHVVAAPATATFRLFVPTDLLGEDGGAVDDLAALRRLF